MTHQGRQQTLLIDADDTLWENEAYFRAVFHSFIALMESRGFESEEVGRIVRRIESDRTAKHGYGSDNFANSLRECAQFLEGDLAPLVASQVTKWRDQIWHHELEIFPKVHETLIDLKQRHTLLLVTKGDLKEQGDKVDRSQFRSLFRAVEILREKDPEHYQGLIDHHALKPSESWMIGNSPRSDINPAKAVGLNTVFIPHRSIWEHEAQAFTQPPDLRLNRFFELSLHF